MVDAHIVNNVNDKVNKYENIRVLMYVFFSASNVRFFILHGFSFINIAKIEGEDEKVKQSETKVATYCQNILTHFQNKLSTQQTT